MTLQSRILRGLLAGALGGLAAWLVIERTGWFALVLDNTTGIAPGTPVYGLQAMLGGVYGLLLSVAIHFADWGGGRDRSAARWRALVLGATAGLCGGIVGIVVGQALYAGITARGASEAAGSAGASVGAELLGVLGRSAGWALIGLSVGLAQGVPRGSWKAARLAGLGGLAGGVAGGCVFEALETVTGSPVAARAIGFTFLGAAIGFFLEFVPLLLKEAWLRIESGPGAGGEYAVTRAVTTIGSDASADISLPGDPRLHALHCEIVRRAEQSGGGIGGGVGAASYRIISAQRAGRAGATAAEPLLVDGSAVDGEQALRGGELLTLGGRTARFHLRNGRAAAPAPPPPPEERARWSAGVHSIRPLAAADPVGSESAAPPIPAATPAAVVAPALPAEQQEPMAMGNDPGEDERSEPPRAVPAPLPLDPAEVGGVASSHRLATDGTSGTRLVGLAGPYHGQVFALATRRTLVVGRGAGCDIRLASDRTISRRHAAFHLDYGQHAVEDLGSANGILVNGEAVAARSARRIAPGDEIALGDSVFRYE